MEHWLILIRAAGDLLYLTAAAVTLAAVRADRSGRHDTGTKQ